jgi:aryl-alcohol dehydrogenase-like predicted oxidoreductase
LPPSTQGIAACCTAPLYGYGLAERRLGACVDTVDRRELTLSTKVGRLLRPGAIAASAGVHAGQHPFEYTYDYSYDGALRSLEFSLQRLGTNRVDIVLIHDVNRRWQGDRIEERYAEAMAGAYRALHDLRAQGVIDAIGVGVNDWEILLRFAADGDFDCFMLAGRYTLLDHTAGARFLPECARRGIAVLMAAPFNSGILATGPVPGATFFYQGADAEILAHPAHLRGMRAPRRRAARRGFAVPAGAPGGGERGHRHAQRRRGHAKHRPHARGDCAGLLARTRARGPARRRRAVARPGLTGSRTAPRATARGNVIVVPTSFPTRRRRPSCRRHPRIRHRNCRRSIRHRC